MTKGEIKQLQDLHKSLGRLTTDGITVFQNGGAKPVIEVIKEYNAVRETLAVVITEATT